MDSSILFFPALPLKRANLQFPWPKVKAVDAQYNVQPESIESMAARRAGTMERWDATTQTNKHDIPSHWRCVIFCRWCSNWRSKNIVWHFGIYKVCWLNLLETHLGRRNPRKLLKIPRVWETTMCFDLGWHGCSQSCFSRCITAVNQNMGP